LEVKHNIQKAMAKRDNQQVNNGGDESGGRKNRKKRRKNGGKNNGNANQNNNNKDNCELCGKPGHAKVDCWEDDRNAAKRPPGYKTAKNRRNRQANRKNDAPHFTAEQMTYLMQGFEALKRNEASKKRKVRVEENDDDQLTPHTHFLAQNNSKVDADTDNDTSDYNSDDYINDYTKNYVFVTSHRTKKHKTKHLSTEVVGQFCDSRGEVFPMRVLFDTGSTSTIVLSKFAKVILPQTSKAVKWKTMGGQFNTTRKAAINFKLPEFGTNKTISWIAHVDETTNPKIALFDLIVGLDLMETLGITISFKDHTITWDDVPIPMKERGLVSDVEAREIIFHTAVQSPIITKCHIRRARNSRVQKYRDECQT